MTRGPDHEQVIELIQACNWAGRVEAFGAARAIVNDVADLTDQLTDHLDIGGEQLATFTGLCAAFVEHWRGRFSDEEEFQEVAEEFGTHLAGLEARRAETLEQLRPA